MKPIRLKDWLVPVVIAAVCIALIIGSCSNGSLGLGPCGASGQPSVPILGLDNFSYLPLINS